MQKENNSLLQKMKQCVVKLDRIPISKIEILCARTTASRKENFVFNVKQNSERTFTITVQQQKNHAREQLNEQNQSRIEVMPEIKPAKAHKQLAKNRRKQVDVQQQKKHAHEQLNEQNQSKIDVTPKIKPAEAHKQLAKNQVKSTRKGKTTIAQQVNVEKGDLIFAKVRGYPFWPALVDEIDEKSRVRAIFFGYDNSW